MGKPSTLSLDDLVVADSGYPRKWFAADSNLTFVSLRKFLSNPDNIATWKVLHTTCQFVKYTADVIEYVKQLYKD